MAGNSRKLISLALVIRQRVFRVFVVKVIQFRLAAFLRFLALSPTSASGGGSFCLIEKAIPVLFAKPFAGQYFFNFST